jgi:hypothetical protein
MICFKTGYGLIVPTEYFSSQRRLLTVEFNTSMLNVRDALVAGWLILSGGVTLVFFSVVAYFTQLQSWNSFQEAKAQNPALLGGHILFPEFWTLSLEIGIVLIGVGASLLIFYRKQEYLHARGLL